MSCWALVPVKRRRDCKTRLAAVLSPGERISLVRATLSHVLGVLQQVPGIDYIAVVSPERDSVPESIEVLAEKGHDLNSSLTAAMAEIANRGASKIVVLHSDLPELLPTDVQSLLEASEEARLAIAPDDRGSGTNALAIRGGLRFSLAFGPGSYFAHVRNARNLGLQPAVVRTPGLGFDLDTSPDLEQFQDKSFGKNTIFRRRGIIV